MKFWRMLLVALLFSIASPVHASSLMDRVAYIEHELGIVPEEDSNIMTRLSAIEEYAGLESSSKSVMDRVADIEQFLGKSLETEDDSASPTSETTSVSDSAEVIPYGAIEWKDEHLEKAIRQFTGRFDGDVLPSHLQGITTLDLSHRNIKDISGLEAMVDLKTLYLEGNQITDLSPLADLKNLSVLFLDENEITDLLPLAGLVNMEELLLDSNQIVDLSPLKGMVKLDSLFLSSNQITDLSPLEGMVELEDLRLADNQVTDISVLRGLQKLETLDLTHNPIKDYSPIEDLYLVKFEK